MEAIIPQLIAASIGFAIYFSVVGTTFLNNFAIPVDDFEPSQPLIGVGLGAVSSLIMVTFAAAVRVVTLGAQKLTHP